MNHVHLSKKGSRPRGPLTASRGLATLRTVGAAFLLVTAASRAASKSAADSLTEEFTVRRDGGSLAVRMQTPSADRLARRPLLLLYFSADRQSSLPDGRYGEPGRIFLEQGHRVASFDLPAHGERVDHHGSGIAGLCARVVAGEKPFDLFVADGRAVIDECIRRRLAEAGRIVTCGVSRGGYCAVRLAAADPRITAVAALAPVTDWRSVQEFAAAKDRPEVAALALTLFAEPLVGRRLYIAIGNHDTRADTDACTRFVLAVGEAERRKGVEHSGVRYLMVDDSPGHALAGRWRREGVQFLLGETTRADAAPSP